MTTTVYYAGDGTEHEAVECEAPGYPHKDAKTIPPRPEHVDMHGTGGAVVRVSVDDDGMIAMDQRQGALSDGWRERLTAALPREWVASAQAYRRAVIAAEEAEGEV